MSSTPWLIQPQSKPQARIRLFCCHPAGSGASIFRSWVKLLPPEIELCALQLPGRETRIREPFITQISPLVVEITQELSPYLKDFPFALFGHSLGALIAFDIARQLRFQQLPQPIHLFLSGRNPPHLLLKNCIHQKPDHVLIEKLREYGGTKEEVLQNSELMELFLPIFRADLTLNETYVYSPDSPFNYPISVFGGMEDHSVNQEQLSQWHKYTSNKFDLNMFAGGHMFFLEQPQPLVSKISLSLI